TIGEKSGSKAEALTTAQMPSHTHTQNAHTHGVSDPGHNHWQDVHWWTARDSSNGSPIGLVGGGQGGWGIAPGTNNNIYWLITTAATATNVPEVTGIGISNATATNQSTGSGSTHNNIQPSIVKLFAIKH
ncbi:hypothetical protein H7X69_00085, partial [Candidatus Saccharibacteria bacterium]|nr:hypothetical protein [Candidatus Saccharibacteria bacterium]